MPRYTRAHPWIALCLLLLALPAPKLAPAPAAPAAPAAAADTVYGLTSTGLLVKFSAATPGTFDSFVPITGTGYLPPVAIDFRPKTGELYAITVSGVGNTATGRLYTLNTTTGVATPVGVTFSNFLSATAAYDIDFNPVADRLRVVNTAGTNLRLNPTTGAALPADTSISCSTPPCQVVGLAYDRNTVGVTVTTAYAIDWDSDSLFTLGGIDGVPSANGGVLDNEKPLGLGLGSTRAGFDIAPSGTAYAALKVGGLYGLYTINLSSGAATLVGSISNGSVEMADIAVPARFRSYLPLARK